MAERAEARGAAAASGGPLPLCEQLYGFDVHVQRGAHDQFASADRGVRNGAPSPSLGHTEQAAFLAAPMPPVADLERTLKADVLRLTNELKQAKARLEHCIALRKRREGRGRTGQQAAHQWGGHATTCC